MRCVELMFCVFSDVCCHLYCIVVCLMLSTYISFQRAAERRFRRSRSSADKLERDRKMKSMRSLYNDKHGYWRNEISVNKGNTQGLWRTLHGVLGDSARNDASPYSADDYAKYFKDEIDSVRACTAATPTYDVPRRVTSSFDEFTSVTTDEVARLISCAPNVIPA